MMEIYDRLLGFTNKFFHGACLNTRQVSVLKQGNSSRGANDILQRIIQPANLTVDKSVKDGELVRFLAPFNTSNPIFHKEATLILVTLKTPS